MINIPIAILNNLDEALSREWIVTNGTGGYASSTPLGANTRQYHGLLVASFPPPLERQVILSKVDEELVIGNDIYPLGVNEYHDGTIHPHGHQALKGFKLDLGIPTFEYHIGGVTLAKQVWMEHGSNTVFIVYRLGESDGDVSLRVRPFCAFRGYHSRSADHQKLESTMQDNCLTVRSGLAPYSLKLNASPSGEFEAHEGRYHDFLYRCDRERGFGCLEDLYTPGIFTLRLSAGTPVGMVATCEDNSNYDIVEALDREMTRRRMIIGKEKNAFRKQLLLAADQFVVNQNKTEDVPHTPTPPYSHTSLSTSILAGYPWFTDWGRDTMIALPGLLVSTGRFAEARDILLRYIECVDGGMIPNRFTDRGSAEYNTADATLWYFQALHAYATASGDREIIPLLLPNLADIIERHISGTRFGIHVDPSDGLLFAGKGKSQLTWMDARVNGLPVTPRVGKPVEINALWYNALRLSSAWMNENGESPERYETAAEKCRESFQRRFWNERMGCCYDVIDGPDGNDPSIRPNQIMAVSLPHSPLDAEHQKLVVDTVERELLTPYGLRTLSANDSKYIGKYHGGPVERDSAYHQGTVWTWLLGQFADAHYRVYGDSEHIADLLKLFHKHLEEAGLGSISEIFDADYPHKPTGTIAQAWSVSELLRICKAFNDKGI